MLRTQGQLVEDQFEIVRNTNEPAMHSTAEDFARFLSGDM